MTGSLCQNSMDELNHDRSLADRGGNAFHASRAHIADREDARQSGFEKIGLPASGQCAPSDPRVEDRRPF